MNYITRAACNGVMPQQYSRISFFIRDTLLASMMRNRDLVRYICAPFGFGKSLLACSYASLMFGFEGVYWFDGENPCFLRDLDAHTLLPDLFDETEVGNLIVFDNVPHLGPARRAQVWDVCSGLVKAGREVVVCATPSADPLRGHEDACICIDAHEMLYNEKDCENLRAQGLNIRQDVPASHPVSKVPGLALCTPDSFSQFLRAHIDEMDNPLQSALSFTMLMLERGNIDDLEVLLGTELSVDDINARRVRSFIQTDEFEGDFAALGFPLKEVLRLLVDRESKKCEFRLRPDMVEKAGLTKENSDWVQGYGYQMWRCRHNAFRADGANGQYILVLPDQDAVIAVTANIGNMQGEINLIWDNILPALQQN